ncbi:hypothetical protein V5799_019721 [Amblyomma americanum]|uniref:Uncharacterized protein n=1 Tax=Amblyomma americanum TaxID=6943 RepID=A0AAQ4EWJ6_AMBAM
MLFVLQSQHHLDSRCSPRSGMIPAGKVCNEGIFELAMEPLDHSIGAGVVCGGTAVLGEEQMPGGEEDTLQPPVTVRCDYAMASQARNPCKGESLCKSFRSDVGMSGNSIIY